MTNLNIISHDKDENYKNWGKYDETSKKGMAKMITE